MSRRDADRENAMETRITHTFVLNDDDDLRVCRHRKCVSFYHSSHEFCIQLTPAHLPEIRELVLELEALNIKQIAAKKNEELVSSETDF